MKRLLTILAVSVALTGYSQNFQPVPTNTTDKATADSLHAAMAAVPAPAAETNTTPIVSSPVWEFVTAGASNWYFGTYVIYDTTSKDFGGGIGAGYKLSEFVVPIMRVDYLNRGGKSFKENIFIPSGNIQLQVPVKLFGKVTVTPFAFTGVATSINNGSDSGDVIGIFGTGAYLGLGEHAWYVPVNVIADYERWTGSGFNDDQIRCGLVWHF